MFRQNICLFHVHITCNCLVERDKPTIENVVSAFGSQRSSSHGIDSAAENVWRYFQGWKACAALFCSNIKCLHSLSWVGCRRRYTPACINYRRRLTALTSWVMSTLRVILIPSSYFLPLCRYHIFSDFPHVLILPSPSAVVFVHGEGELGPEVEDFVIFPGIKSRNFQGFWDLKTIFDSWFYQRQDLGESIDKLGEWMLSESLVNAAVIFPENW